MNELKVGDVLSIHCYKHDGKLHRTWNEATILEITDDMSELENDPRYKNYKTQNAEFDDDEWGENSQNGEKSQNSEK